MKTFLLPLAVMVSLAASSATKAASDAYITPSNTPTHSSGLHANGRAFNGMKINGMKINGVRLNGLTLNGIKWNGVTLNGISWNGVVFNGLVLNGRFVNGKFLNGALFDGSSSTLNFAAVAPATAQTAAGADWSSLALADVRVRLPLAR